MSGAIQITLEDRGTVYDGAQKSLDERVASFTALARTMNGTLLCMFQVGPFKQAPTSTLRICQSTDNGRTWKLLNDSLSSHWQGTPGSFAAGEMIEVSPGKLLLIATWFDRSDQARPLFDPSTQGILKSRQLKAFSKDEGQHWTEWEEIDVGELSGCSCTGPLLRWQDGTIAYPMESYKVWDDERPGAHAAWLLPSYDGGVTFEAPILVAQHPKGHVYYWDQRLSEARSPGEFVGLFWTHDLIAKKDLAVHALRGALVAGEIHAHGPWPTAIPGQIAAPIVVDSNVWIAFAVCRSPKPTLTLWISHDNGVTWPTEPSLEVYAHAERAELSHRDNNNIDFVEYWNDMTRWTFGHPAMRRMEQSQYLLAYYCGTPEATRIEWVRICLNRSA